MCRKNMEMWKPVDSVAADWIVTNADRSLFFCFFFSPLEAWKALSSNRVFIPSKEASLIHNTISTKYNIRREVVFPLLHWEEIQCSTYMY